LSTLEAVTPRAASLSPDGRLLAHERYSSGASPRDLGGAVLDLATGQDRSLGDDTALPVFASSSTVWALEADPAQSGPFGNQETGRVISINLTSGSQSALPFPRYAGGFAFL
jgi:hypothetical protein